MCCYVLPCALLRQLKSAAAAARAILTPAGAVAVADPACAGHHTVASFITPANLDCRIFTRLADGSPINAAIPARAVQGALFFWHFVPALIAVSFVPVLHIASFQASMIASLTSCGQPISRTSRQS